MDFVFNCLSCHGPLIARTVLRGVRVQCAHCSGGIEVHGGNVVTEALVDALLDAPLSAAPPARQVLRRVRPATHQSSAGTSRVIPRLSRGVRISHVV